MNSALINSYRKMNILRFSPYKCIRNLTSPCQKVGQGQPRFIICANLVGPTSTMLHTKSQSQWPFGEEEVFTIFGRGGHLSHVTITICINFG